MMRRRPILAAVLGGTQYWQHVRKVFASSLQGYWPIWEASGTTAFDRSGNERNGTYAGFTLGQPGIGDSHTCGQLTGGGSLDNFPAGMLNAINLNTGVFNIWLKVTNAAVWSDATNRYVLQITSGSDSLWMRKTTTANTMQVAHIVDGTTRTFNITISTTDWFNLSIRWDNTGGGLLAVYINQTLANSTTAIGTWAGAAPTVFNIGATTVGGSSPWSGYLAHAAIGNSSLTEALIQSISGFFL